MKNFFIEFKNGKFKNDDFNEYYLIDNSLK